MPRCRRNSRRSNPAAVPRGGDGNHYQRACNSCCCCGQGTQLQFGCGLHRTKLPETHWQTPCRPLYTKARGRPVCLQPVALSLLPSACCLELVCFILMDPAHTSHTPDTAPTRKPPMSAVTALALHGSRLGSGPSGTSTHPASTPYTIARIVGASALQNTYDRRRAESIRSVEGVGTTVQRIVCA